MLNFNFYKIITYCAEHRLLQTYDYTRQKRGNLSLVLWTVQSIFPVQWKFNNFSSLDGGLWGFFVWLVSWLVGVLCWFWLLFVCLYMCAWVFYHSQCPVKFSVCQITENQLKLWKQSVTLPSACWFSRFRNHRILCLSLT